MNRALVTVPIACLVMAFAAGAFADHSHQRACTRTSHLMQSACRAEIRDDYLVLRAKCLNEKERHEQRSCAREAKDELKESAELCHEQLHARLDVCDAIGEAPYDPSFEPEDFEDDLASLTNPNPYAPLQVGYEWTLTDGSEIIEISVLDATKLIDDITCFVVRDIVTIDGDLVEDTDDWFAHGTDGSVWYCGEEVKDYEFFDGDNPRLPELVSIDGAFKVERDNDRAGIIFQASPEVGQVYRQEFSLGNAEDMAEIMSIDYSYGNDEELDNLVPQELAELLCNDDCVVVAEFSPLEPSGYELKYFARGIGFFLATVPEDEEAVQLVACNFDARCDALPQP